MWSHIFLFGILLRRRPSEFTAILMFEFWREATAALVPGFLRKRLHLKFPNMAAAGEKTLAHSRNHGTDSSTESGNLFKIAPKIKSERIWVRGLETGEKQTKWRQRKTRKKLKICKNALKGHRNTAEWYMLFSVPWPSFVLSLNALAYMALYNCLQINFSTPASFHCFLFFAYSECQRFSFLFSWKGEPFLTVSAIYFMLGISRMDL